MVEKLDWFQMDQTVGSFSLWGIHVIRSVDLEDDAIIIV